MTRTRKQKVVTKYADVTCRFVPAPAGSCGIPSGYWHVTGRADGGEVVTLYHGTDAEKADRIATTSAR